MSEWPRHYILVNRVPFAVDLMTWALWFENFDNRCVASTEFGSVRVSTVFLGLDHNWRSVGDPVLFESMVFGGPPDGTMQRYSTWAAAEAGHAELVVEARKARARVDAIRVKAHAHE